MDRRAQASPTAPKPAPKKRHLNKNVYVRPRSALPIWAHAIANMGPYQICVPYPWPNFKESSQRDAEQMLSNRALKKRSAETSQRELAKRVLKKSSQREFSNMFSKSLRREFSKRVLQERSERALSKQALQESTQRVFKESYRRYLSAVQRCASRPEGRKLHK